MSIIINMMNNYLFQRQFMHFKSRKCYRLLISVSHLMIYIDYIRCTTLLPPFSYMALAVSGGRNK